MRCRNLLSGLNSNHRSETTVYTPLATDPDSMVTLQTCFVVVPLLVALPSCFSTIASRDALGGGGKQQVSLPFQRDACVAKVVLARSVPRVRERRISPMFSCISFSETPLGHGRPRQKCFFGGDRKGTTKKLCDKDFAERSGELSGAICLKTLVLLRNDR